MKSDIARLLGGLIVCYSFIAQGGVSAPFEKGRPNSCYLGFGYDYALFTLELGYARAIELPGFSRQLTLNADLTIPALKPDLFDWRARAGAMMSTVERGYFHIPVHLDALFRSSKNSSCRASGFGTALSVMPGIRVGAFSANAELTWDQQWATFIEHTDAYRQWVFAGAKDGWYGNTAFIIRYGARAGILMRDRIEMLLNGGYEQDGKFDYRTPPVYAIVSTNIRF